MLQILNTFNTSCKFHLFNERLSVFDTFSVKSITLKKQWLSFLWYSEVNTIIVTKNLAFEDDLNLFKFDLFDISNSIRVNANWYADERID